MKNPIAELSLEMRMNGTDNIVHTSEETSTEP